MAVVLVVVAFVDVSMVGRGGEGWVSVVVILVGGVDGRWERRW